MCNAVIDDKLQVRQNVIEEFQLRLIDSNHHYTDSKVELCGGSTIEC